MRVITTEPLPSSSLPALIVEPESRNAESPVLLFLHGLREAGELPNELPRVCIHQSPPWHAMAGRLPEVCVVAPQAPPHPDEDHWTWRDHVKTIAEFIQGRSANRRPVATGFSRGGLGVLQILEEYPDLFERWAILDPQPPGNAEEARAILSSPAMARGWVRYGVYRERSPAWTQFASALEARLPEAARDVTTFDHGDLALRAYRGESLSSSGQQKQNVYEFLGVRF